MKRYSHHDLHKLLAKEALSAKYNDPKVDEIGAQAIYCPYYVPLAGQLGADWGVIVNPKSARFARLTFEHDDCGCPRTRTEEIDGWGRHSGDPSQQGDTWDKAWLRGGVRTFG